MPAFARTAGLHGPVFNSLNLGGYLAWELYPGTRDLPGSRLQAYPPEHFRAILDASRDQAEWDALVAASTGRCCLSRGRTSSPAPAGFGREQWPTVFWDEAVDVRVRRGGRFDPLVQRSE